MIAIIDLGSGNLRSVEKALHQLGYPAQVTTHTPTITKAQAVILPGVGAFGKAMAALQQNGLAEAIHMTIDAGKPFMGICLGLQLLFQSSEEFGEVEGLGVVPGKVKRLRGPQFADAAGGGASSNPPAGGAAARGASSAAPKAGGLKVPHIGWNAVRIAKPHPVFEGIPDGAMFYFVHSYAGAPASREWVYGVTEYGVKFTSAIARGKLFACQFHPEKSGRVGLRMLDNFARMAYPKGPPEPPAFAVGAVR